MHTVRPIVGATRSRARTSATMTACAAMARSSLVALAAASFAATAALAADTPVAADEPVAVNEPPASAPATTPAPAAVEPAAASRQRDGDASTAPAPPAASAPAARNPSTPAHATEAQPLAATSATVAEPKPLLPAKLAPMSSPEAARAFAAPTGTIVDAREAFRRRDAARLATLRSQVQANAHALASWVDYWDLTNRLDTAQPSEVEAFYERWRGRYVEDRLRNDWLLELGRRRDWARLAADFARFVMNDDREVTCHALTARHLEGATSKHASTATLKREAFDAWLDQKDVDDGCHHLATTLHDARVFDRDDVWRKVRRAIDQGRPRAARQAAGILGDAPAQAVADIVSQPARWLNHKADTQTRQGAELTAIALARLAASDPELALLTLRTRWEKSLPPELLAWTWAQLGEQAAQKLMPDAHDHVLAAFRSASTSPGGLAALGDETLAWAVRAALRSTHAQRWSTVEHAIEAMRPAARADATWRYWLARARLGSARPGEGATQQARAELAALSGELHFYGLLAAEDLGQRFALPARPPAMTPAERDATRGHPGLVSALAMIAAGLRDEGIREWNYSLRGMDDRQLLAAAQWACEREVWDRCINTSDRSRALVDTAQRYPTPFRRQLDDAAQASGVEPAFAYGVIRQESRFIPGVRSHVGASGLMQLMPATARWTAKRVGMTLAPGAIIDPDVNLRLGTQYLKLVLDDFEGSHAMAAAAYNAGPSRPRRWREGSPIEAAAWAETIPFDETRDYVKKVLTNTIVYAALLGKDATRVSLKARLGTAIGPREATAKVVDRELP